MAFLMPTSFGITLRQRILKIKVIMYQWDSNKFNPYAHWKPIVDKLMTFDHLDSKENDIPYLPLFFTNDILELRCKDKPKDINYLYVSTYSWERYCKLLELIKAMKNCCFFYYLYIPFSVYMKELFRFRFINIKYLPFRPLARENYLNLLSRTYCLIDVTNSHQSGLPMRIVEGFGMGVNVLSTNPYVVHETNMAGNIKYFDDFSELKRACFDKIVNNDIVMKYSINNWLKYYLT